MDVVTMPQLGETVTEGTITAWSKAVGDEVAVDDALFEVSTEKVDTEVPSAFAGVLRAVLVDEGETVAVGVPVAVIAATADEPIDLDAVPGASAAAPTEAGVDAPGSFDGGPIGEPRSAGHGSSSSRSSARARARSRAASGPRREVRERDGDASAVHTPVVRRLVEELGVDLRDVVGTGRDGRITRADVLAAAANAGRRVAPEAASPAVRQAEDHSAAAPIEVGPDDEVVPLSKARTATAGHLRRSLDTAAHALVIVQVDYAGLEPVRRAAKLSYLPFVARAVVDGLREFPHLNSSFDRDRLVVHRDVHLGVAVDLDQEALVVPVLPKAQDLRLRALADGIADLAERARRRRLPGDAFSGGTFTVTNVGSYGTVATAPIINQPQVAILSSDGVRMTPVAVPVDGPSASTASPDGWAVAVHPVGNLSLSFDHRAVDGAYAAAFLARVRTILQERDWHAEVAP